MGIEITTCGCLFHGRITKSTIAATASDEREEIDAIRPSILLRLPASTESLVKGYDLKPLSKY